MNKDKKKAAPKKPASGSAPKAASKKPAPKPAAKKAPAKKPAPKKGSSHAAPAKAAPKKVSSHPAPKKPAAAPKPKAPAKPKPTPKSKATPSPAPDQAKKAAERLVGSLIRALLASRKRSYIEGISIEKKFYATNLFEESRRTYTRYIDAEGKEKILKAEPVGPTTVHVYTSGEGMGKNRYTCSWEKKLWRITAVDVMCGDCSGAGACRWCEGKGCIDCQSTGRCVPCSGTGWARWAK